MNTIEPLSLTRFTTNELVKTGKGVADLAEQLAATSPFIARNVSAIKATLATIAEIDNKDPKKSHTDEIVELDRKLDALLPVTEGALLSNVKSADFFPEKGAASAVIIAAFEKRDRQALFHGSYSAQGREMSALLQEIYAEENAQHRTDSGCAPQLDALNDTFTRLNVLINERRSEGNLPSTLKEQKSILRYRVERLLSYIDANILDEVEGFAEIKTPMNQLVTEIMSEYRARMTRKKNAEE